MKSVTYTPQDNRWLNPRTRLEFLWLPKTILTFEYDFSDLPKHDDTPVEKKDTRWLEFASWIEFPTDVIHTRIGDIRKDNTASRAIRWEAREWLPVKSQWAELWKRIKTYFDLYSRSRHEIHN